MKLLDAKLSRILEGSYRPSDFIIADAKDGDMGFGLTSPGPERTAEDGSLGIRSLKGVGR